MARIIRKPVTMLVREDNDAAITASWLDDSDKAVLRAEFSNPDLAR